MKPIKMDLVLPITFSHDNFVIRKYGIKEFRGQFDQTLDLNVSIIRIDKRQMQVNKARTRQEIVVSSQTTTNENLMPPLIPIRQPNG